MKLRPYQTRVIDDLHAFWMHHTAENSVVVMPTGSGKSIVIAELVRIMFDTFPEHHPRTLVLVPSKELAEQNAEKLVKLLPNHISIGFYSASLGKKRTDADVTVATIGSIVNAAHLLGDIKLVIIDECHLVNPDGAGMYRKFLDDLARLCKFAVVGFTATPFRGNGVWLTDGDDPLFQHIAVSVSVRELLDAGYLSPLVRPVDIIETRVDTTGVSTSTGDYNISQLDERVLAKLPGAADEVVKLAADRKKLIAFLPSVVSAHAFAEILEGVGISAVVVIGDTPKKERENSIRKFRSGHVRCLVSVLALTTGFDVPDVDCIIWLRPTVSPVLYVQGAGRGLRIAEGKTDCLWLDFTDTTERLGVVDDIKGRKKPKKDEDATAPFAICDNCGNTVRPASAITCPFCGAVLRVPEAEPARAASNAPVMSHQVQPIITDYDITLVSYSLHNKADRPASMKVNYWSGHFLVASEYICLAHTGFAQTKAIEWWNRRDNTGCMPSTAQDAVLIAQQPGALKVPVRIRVNESEKFPKIVGYAWEHENEQSRIAG